MNIENPDKLEPGVISIEDIENGNTMLLHIRQVGGEVVKFTVPSKSIVGRIVLDNPEL